MIENIEFDEKEEIKTKNIFNVDKENLNEIFKNEDFIESTFEEIKKLKEKILVGKSI